MKRKISPSPNLYTLLYIIKSHLGKVNLLEERNRHHDGQERHSVHLRRVDIDAGNVQDGRAEVDVGHQQLSAAKEPSSVMPECATSTL